MNEVRIYKKRIKWAFDQYENDAVTLSGDGYVDAQEAMHAWEKEGNLQLAIYIEADEA